MAIYILQTEHLFTPKQAKRWCRSHVVVSKADLKKIEKLARKEGILRKLKALGIMMREIAPGVLDDEA